MSLTTENIDKIAHLARLGLSGDDRTRYTDSLNSILGLIDDLQAVNTQGIEPLAHAFEVNQPLRVDSRPLLPTLSAPSMPPLV